MISYKFTSLCILILKGVLTPGQGEADRGKRKEEGTEKHQVITKEYVSFLGYMFNKHNGTEVSRLSKLAVKWPIFNIFQNG